MRISSSGLLLTALATGWAVPGFGEPWSKAYVVDWVETAMYYGGNPDGGPFDKGADCPQGINRAPDWHKVLVTDYRSQAEVDRLLDPENSGGTGSIFSVYPIRGPDKANVYEKPWLVEDPGLLEVEGNIAYGFNLDGNASTGFTSPDGDRGVDNALYKASGCLKRYRAPLGKADSAVYLNDRMHEGGFTIVLVLSGEVDPENDPDARLGFYTSDDKLVRDTNNGIAPDYTFKLDGNPLYQSTIEVVVEDGVIRTKKPSRIVTRDYWGLNARDNSELKRLTFENAMLELKPKEDGSIEGFIGGYTEWMHHYLLATGDGRDVQGGIEEQLGEFQLPAWWYALKRHADGPVDPQTGDRPTISTTYRYRAIPAFATMPNGESLVKKAELIVDQAIPTDTADAAGSSSTGR